jgi:2-polyprenyl-3-methyl-5-hydroxy-6-metoxy-1,4-benzoquinol methylase
MVVLKNNDKLLKGLLDKRKFYEQVAKTKGDTDDYWAAGFYQSLLIEMIDHLLKDVDQRQIIDVGCGDGRTALALVKQKNTVLGVDVAYTRLWRAQHKTAGHSSSTFFVQSYAESMPLKKELFDGAICTEVLEHVLDDDAVLKELSYVLKPNAWVLMSIPTVSLSRYFDMRYTKQLIYFDPVEHVREFSYVKIPRFENAFVLIKDLKKKLRHYGFTVKNRYGVGFELPLGIRRFNVGRLCENIYRNRKANKLFMKLPLVKNFGVYTVLILQKVRHKPFNDHMRSQ